MSPFGHPVLQKCPKQMRLPRHATIVKIPNRPWVDKSCGFLPYLHHISLHSFHFSFFVLIPTNTQSENESLGIIVISPAFREALSVEGESTTHSVGHYQAKALHTFNIERYGHLYVLICSLQISYHFQTEKAGVFSLLGRALFSCLALCVFVAFVSQLCSSGCYHRISHPPVQQQTTADQIGSYVFILGV